MRLSAAVLSRANLRPVRNTPHGSTHAARALIPSPLFDFRGTQGACFSFACTSPPLSWQDKTSTLCAQHTQPSLLYLLLPLLCTSLPLSSREQTQTLCAHPSSPPSCTLCLRAWGRLHSLRLCGGKWVCCWRTRTAPPLRAAKEQRRRPQKQRRQSRGRGPSV